jgi:hypothetical protein
MIERARADDERHAGFDCLVVSVGQLHVLKDQFRRQFECG